MLSFLMPLGVLEDFLDVLFLSLDDICKFDIYRSRKYENRVKHIVSHFIGSKKITGVNDKQ